MGWDGEGCVWGRENGKSEISVRGESWSLTHRFWKAKKKKSKLACPCSQRFVMRIGRILRKTFFSEDRITMKGTREAKPRVKPF